MAHSDHSLRVLVVEDSPVQRALYAGVLASRFGVDAVSRLSEAEERLREPGRFSAVLADLWLPDGSGLTLARGLQQHDPDLPVLLLTAEPSMQTAIDAVGAGVHRYLTKPCPPDVLIAEIDSASRDCRLARVRRRLSRVLDGRPVAKPRLGRIGRPSRSVVNEAIEAAWLAAQPIVRVSDRSVYAYEFLLRSRSNALVGPLAIIEGCEHHHCLTALGRKVRALAAERAAACNSGARLFINLHPTDLADPLLGEPSDVLDPYSRRITLEITERARLVGVDTDAALRRLRGRGFELAIDDLGSGYSGLSSFIDVNPGTVKIDMSLVRGIEADATRQALVRSVVEMGAALGTLVVAEGVETRAERDTLIAAGLDLLQGYFFGRPSAEFIEPARTTFD